MEREKNQTELSEIEKELIAQYFNIANANLVRDTIVNTLLYENKDSSDGIKNWEDLLPYISDDIDPMQLQYLTLQRMKREILEKADMFAEYSYSDEVFPDDALVTPEKLTRLFVRQEVVNYFLYVGVMIEDLTDRLFIDRIVSAERTSNQVENKVGRMTQSHTQWLLFISGEIDNEANTKISRAYDLRNELAHGLTRDKLLEEFSDLKNDVELAYEGVNLLHEELNGITMEMSFSNLIA